MLTLGPIYALDAGLDIYPQWTVGTFVWRTPPLLDADRRAFYQVLSFHDLEAALANDLPQAILTGVEDHSDGFGRYGTARLEDPFLEYAVRHGYQVVYRGKPPFWINEMVVWVRL